MMKTKKLFSVIIALIIIASVIILPQKISKTVSAELSISQKLGKEPLYAAHRGLSALYPQNTTEAFEAAAKEGFYAFECDVHTTADGKFVVIHDDTVDKMTDGSGEVEDFTYEELMNLNIDSGNGIKNYDNLKIPTLEETLAVCDKYDIVPIIELKKLDTKYLPEFYEALKKHEILEKAIIISFNFDYLLEMRRIDKDIEMMYLVKIFNKETVDKCKENGNIGIDYKYQDTIFNLSSLKYAKQQGLKIGAWTVDNTIYSDIMCWAGNDLITTNRILPKK